jgi:predicted dehydrogenase
MTLEEIFYASQSIAAVAVIASILYLAQQVRQADRVQRGIMQQGRADRVAQSSLMVADPALARIVQKGLAANTDFTPDEFMQWTMISRAIFISGEDSFLQHRAGLLSNEAFGSYVAGVHSFMAAPGMRAAWKLFGRQFGNEYRAFVDAILKQAPPAHPGASLEEWQKLARAEIGSAPPAQAAIASGPGRPIA